MGGAGSKMDIRLMPLSPRPEAERRRLDGELRKFSRQLQSAESWSSGDEQAVRVLVKDLQSELDAYLVEASKNLLFDSGAVAKLQAQIDFAGADDKILRDFQRKYCRAREAAESFPQKRVRGHIYFPQVRGGEEEGGRGNRRLEGRAARDAAGRGCLSGAGRWRRRHAVPGGLGTAPGLLARRRVGARRDLAFAQAHGGLTQAPVSHHREGQVLDQVPRPSRRRAGRRALRI